MAQVPLKKKKAEWSDKNIEDIVHLSIGDIVPADRLFTSGFSLLIDESSRSGESEVVNVDQQKHFLLSDGFCPAHIPGSDSMEGRFAEELYAESLHLSKLELGPTSANDQENKSNDCDGDDLSLDGSLWDGSDDKLDNSSDLDREWQRRHDQFHTIGYRDGLIAGKEASAQEGFNIGFKQSVLTGYSWGVARGVTSAFAYLPDQFKENMVETLEKRNEFQGLYESVHSLSTTDALRLFNEDIKAKEALEQSEHVEVSPHTTGLQEQASHVSHLRNYHGQLESLIRESPAIDIHLPEME